MSESVAPPDAESTVTLTNAEALWLYNWLESDDAPDYWTDATLAPLHSRLSAWHKYESPI